MLNEVTEMCNLTATEQHNDSALRKTLIFTHFNKAEKLFCHFKNAYDTAVCGLV